MLGETAATREGRVGVWQQGVRWRVARILFVACRGECEWQVGDDGDDVRVGVRRLCFVPILVIAQTDHA